MKLVEITWVDIISYGGWHNLEDAIEGPCEDMTLHKSCGYLIKEDKKAYKIAMTKALNRDTVGEILEIPRAVVKRVEILRNK